VTRSYDKTQVLINSDMADIEFPARSLWKVSSANSLKEEGTSHDAGDDSYWLMATSAMSNPDTRLTRYIAGETI